MDDGDDDEIKTDDSTEVERKRKKVKKAKKKKNKKKKKKKRNKSISSVENISDNDSMLDEDLNLTPPIHAASPEHWDKRYTPNRVDSLSKSPTTPPPIRPSSNMSIYSDTGTIKLYNCFSFFMFSKFNLFHYFILCLFMSFVFFLLFFSLYLSILLSSYSYLIKID